MEEKLGNTIMIPAASRETSADVFDIGFSADSVTEMNILTHYDGIKPRTDDFENSDGVVKWVNGYNIRVAPLLAIVNGSGIISNAAIDLTIDDSGSEDRFDLIVVRRDYLERTANIMIIKGAEGTGVPSLQKNHMGIYDFLLAEIKVSAGILALSQTDITDKRIRIRAVVGEVLEKIVQKGAEGIDLNPVDFITSTNIQGAMSDIVNNVAKKDLSNITTLESVLAKYETDWFEIVSNSAYGFDLSGENINLIGKEKRKVGIYARVKTAKNGYLSGDILPIPFSAYRDFYTATSRFGAGCQILFSGSSLKLVTGRDFITAVNGNGGDNADALTFTDVEIKIIVEGWKI